MVKNKNKLPLKDLEPEEIKEILNTDFDDLEWYSHVDIKGWHQYGRDVFGKEIEMHNRYYNYMIYRTKPKKLTPNNLYDKFDHGLGMVQTEYVLECIKQLEGYKE